MSARERIADRLWWSVPSSDDADAKSKASAMLDAFAAEVVAERDAQIIAWLGKKAREYKGNRAESASDALARMADKISRGAVCPTPTGRQASAPQPHRCGNCDGIDPDSCLFNTATSGAES